MENPLGLTGIGFVEFSSSQCEKLQKLFTAFGFEQKHFHKASQIEHYQQNGIHFLLNKNQSSFGGNFANLHGPSISAMGWMFQNPQKAFQEAIKRGARPFVASKNSDSIFENNIPAIYGIGDSLIYFLESEIKPNQWTQWGFEKSVNTNKVQSKGFTLIDHLTNNVENGTMKYWADFYKNIFGFSEVRYFDIRGVKTGLQSFALKSPCGTFCIPINEATESKSQINEYLNEYKGPGIQHLAFLTNDILNSLDQMSGSQIETLDIDDEYYEEAFQRVKQVTENKDHIKKHKVLVDGDDEGYLLQIFTKNLIGPIFIEIIQRKNHYSFGEGNFTALFRSIERDQEKRGVL